MAQNSDWKLSCTYCLYVLRFATSRLLTFELQSTWLPQPGVRPDLLAEAGFFLPVTSLRKVPDQVKCTFCGLEIGNWKRKHDPFLRHSKYSKKCPFFNDAERIGNVEFDEYYFTPVRRVRRRRYLERLEGTKVLSEEPAPDHPRSVTFKRFQSTKASGVGPLGPFHVPQMDTTSDEIAKTVYMKPAYRKCTKESRLATFPSKWCPKYCPVPAEKLAEAGFFILDKNFAWKTYSWVPIEDVVTCFCCGVQVFGWHEYDDPWKVHQLFQRDCYFMALSSPVKKCEPETVCEKNSSPQAHAEIEEEKGICNICLTERINVLCKPCKHASFCSNCSSRIAECPICREYIKSRREFVLT